MTADRRGLALVALLALVWGSNFLWIKVALDGLGPVPLTFARLAAGTVVLGVLVWARRERVPGERRLLGHLVVAALVGNAAPYLLFAIGEQSVDSAIAGVINATTPLWTVFIAAVTRQERRLGPGALAGLALGFAGAVVIFEPWRVDAGGSLGGQLACLAAAASYGLSYVYMARYLAPRNLSPFVLAFGQTAAATALFLPALAVTGAGDVTLTGDVVGAMVALGPVGTGLAYVVNYAIITREGATLASTVTYLLPVVSVALGVTVLDESVRPAALVGAAVVLTGVALTRRKRPAPGPTRAPAPR